MGLWLDEQRHGSAVVVTQCGVYYEGTFKENKMNVRSARSQSEVILSDPCAFPLADAEFEKLCSGDGFVVDAH